MLQSVDTYPDLEVAGITWVFLVVSIRLIEDHALNATQAGVRYDIDKDKKRDALTHSRLKDVPRNHAPRVLSSAGGCKSKPNGTEDMMSFLKAGADS